MRLIVDEMPKKADDCMFSFCDYGRMFCRLCKGIDQTCRLDNNKECPCLYPIGYLKVDVPGVYNTGKIRT